MATYRNPWHRHDSTCYGPPTYSTEVKPVDYRGIAIYQFYRGIRFDVVINGVCRAQCRGLSGAKRWIDEYLETCALVNMSKSLDQGS